jgi:hypothetical protein
VVRHYRVAPERSTAKRSGHRSGTANLNSAISFDGQEIGAADSAHPLSSVQGTGGPAQEAAPVDLVPLHAKIGQLALENDFWERALTKAGLLSAKP